MIVYEDHIINNSEVWDGSNNSRPQAMVVSSHSTSLEFITQSSVNFELFRKGGWLFSLSQKLNMHSTKKVKKLRVNFDDFGLASLKNEKKNVVKFLDFYLMCIYNIHKKILFLKSMTS